MEKRLIDSYRDIIGAATVAFKDPRAKGKAEQEAMGIICGDSPKTITSSIRWNGREHLDWSSDYKLFSRAKWSHDGLFRHIINVSTFAVKELCRLSGEVHRFSGGSRRMIHCVDGSFASKVYMGGAPDGVAVVARGRKNARLRNYLPPDRRIGNRKYGNVLPAPEEILREKSMPWKSIRMFIAGKRRTLKYKEISSVCWPGVASDKPMRLIVIKAAGYRLRKGSDLLYRQPAFLFALNSEGIPTRTLIEAYLARWEVEVTFRDAKNVIGVGQAQVWNEVSVEKAPAFVSACHACLLLASIKAFGDRRTDEVFGPLPAWRRIPQRRPSIRDLVNLIRKEALAEALEEPKKIKIAS
ncbi:MAG: hypothetical protein DDT25_01105 [Chloroflexi bacterium]|nr:hypothetical protein [Chloroflexota bacterium]